MRFEIVRSTPAPGANARESFRWVGRETLFAHYLPFWWPQCAL
jgi:hypothetical protein